MPKESTIKWLAGPEEHDYPAALSYLSLHYDEQAAKDLVESLRKAAISTFKSRDIFRASGLPLLGLSNRRVEKDRDKITKGVALSPILLVRAPDYQKLIIADGYHRLCAAYSYDQETLVPCKIV